MKRLTLDARIALCVGFGVLMLLALTASNGYVRDEGFYFRAAREYNAWSFDFSDDALKRTFGFNTEHPGFAKIMMGWTWRVMHVGLGLCSGATGFRLGAMVLVAVGAAFTYLFGLRLTGSRVVGLLAIAFYFGSPHVFYHAHLACFDAPVTGLIVAATYAFWRSTESRRWVPPAGLLWGIALATKHNAVFTYAGFGLTWLIVSPRKPPLSLWVIPIVGALVFYVFYPYGWHHPLERIGAYYDYHAHHEHYPVDFFGTLYTKPPFPLGYAFRMTALTVPLVTLVLGCVGVVRWMRVRSYGAVLLVLGVLIPLLVISFPSVPIFGGTKHWMPMMPFFCIAAASVLAEIASKGRVAIAVSAVAVVLPWFDVIRTHPNGQTYFNELVMGHQGGAYLGLPRTFWGGDGRAMLATLNASADPHAKVFTHRMNTGDWNQYRADGLVRPDLIQVRTPAEADWGLMYHQREHQDVEYLYWQRHAVLVDTLMYDGVSLVSLYRLNTAPSSASTD